MCEKASPLLGWTLMIAFCVGCGPRGPEIATVEGTVTMDGRPLPDAAVLFVPEGGRPAAAKTDADGHYVLNFTAGRRGAIPGRNVVRITTLSAPSEDVNGNEIPGAPERVPMRYNALTTLEFDVVAGEKNIANFELTSDGQVIQQTGDY